MKTNEYTKIVNEITPKSNKSKNVLIAFLSGGLVGVIGTIINNILSFYGLGREDSGIWTLIILIFLACLLTALGGFDKLVEKCRCGLIIPITGFAHSVCSSAMDYRKDGFITGLGSNIFKLAGSVLLYGIVSAFIFCIIRVLIGG